MEVVVIGNDYFIDCLLYDGLDFCIVDECGVCGWCECCKRGGGEENNEFFYYNDFRNFKSFCWLDFFIVV